MSVSGIGQNYYRNNVASAQSKRNVSNIKKQTVLWVGS